MKQVRRLPVAHVVHPFVLGAGQQQIADQPRRPAAGIHPVDAAERDRRRRLVERPDEQVLRLGLRRVGRVAREHERARLPEEQVAEVAPRQCLVPRHRSQIAAAATDRGQHDRQPRPPTLQTPRPAIFMFLDLELCGKVVRQRFVARVVDGRSTSRNTNRKPDQTSSIAQTLLSTSPTANPSARTSFSVTSVATPDAVLRPGHPQSTGADRAAA